MAESAPEHRAPNLEITFEGEPIDRIDFHVGGKSLWAKVLFANGRKIDVELEKSRKHAIVEQATAEVG